MLIPTVTTVRRYEIWSALACAGGVPLARARTVLAARASVAVGAEAAEPTVNVTLPASSRLAAVAQRGRVLRLVESDTVWDEWVIVSDTWTIAGGALEQVALVAGSPIVAANAAAGPVADVVAGSPTYDLELVGRTPTEILSAVLLPHCTREGVTWLAAGTIEPTAPIESLVVSWQTPGALLAGLAAAAPGEWRLRRNGTTGYLVDVLTKIGAGATLPTVRAGRDLVGTTAERSLVGRATRIIPRGGDLGGGQRATMGRAVWRVQAIAGSVVTLEDPAGGAGPLVADGQLVGRYLRTTTGALRQITASSAAAQTVTLASAAGVAVGNRVEIRADAAGTRLTTVQHPAAVAAEGVVTDTVDVDGVLETVNLLPNPAARAWAGGAGTLPDGWAKVGTPAVTKQTAAPYVRTGPNTIHVQATADGQGVLSPVSPPGALAPTGERPYLSGFAWLWVVSGTVRVELVATGPGGVVRYYPAGGEEVATNEVTGLWTALGVSGEDALADGLTDVRLRILQHGATPAEFYVDAVQASDTASHEPWVESSGGVTLWQAANRRLLEAASVGGTRYSVTVLELRQWDPARWGAAGSRALPPLTLGGDVAAIEPRLGGGHPTTVASRLVGLVRDYVHPEATQLTVSSEPEDLSAAFRRARELVRTTPQVTEAPIAARALAGLDPSGRVQLGVLAGADVAGTTATQVASGAGRALAALDGSNALVTAVTAGATVGGVSASGVASGATRALAGLDADGVLTSAVAAGADVAGLVASSVAAGAGRANTGLGSDGTVALDLPADRTVAGKDRSLADLLDLASGGVGPNVLENASFEAVPNAGTGDLAAGWYLQASTPRITGALETNAANAVSGTRKIVLSLVGGQTVPAGATEWAAVTSRRLVTAKPGQKWVLRAQLRVDSNVALPSGLTWATFCFVRVNWSDGSISAFQVPTITTTTAGYVARSVAFTVPAAPAGATCTGIGTWLYAEVKNTTGAPIALPLGTARAARVDNVELVRVLSLDDEIADGSTYQRTTGDEKAGAARAFAALDELGALVTAVGADALIDGTEAAQVALGTARALLALSAAGAFTGGTISGDTDLSGGSLYVPADQVVGVGAAGAPTAITRTYRLPHSAFVPKDLTALERTTRTNGQIGVTTAGFAANTQHYGWLLAAPGVTLTRITARLYRETTSSEVAQVILLRGTTTIATLTHTGTGWQEVQVVLAEPVTATTVYELAVTLRTDVSTNSENRAALAWVELEYQRSSYADVAA